MSFSHKPRLFCLNFKLDWQKINILIPRLLHLILNLLGLFLTEPVTTMCPVTQSPAERILRWEIGYQKAYTEEPMCYRWELKPQHVHSIAEFHSLCCKIKIYEHFSWFSDIKQAALQWSHHSLSATADWFLSYKCAAAAQMPLLYKVSSQQCSWTYT